MFQCDSRLHRGCPLWTRVLSDIGLAKDSVRIYQYSSKVSMVSNLIAHFLSHSGTSCQHSMHCPAASSNKVPTLKREWELKFAVAICFCSC